MAWFLKTNNLYLNLDKISSIMIKRKDYLKEGSSIEKYYPTIIMNNGDEYELPTMFSTKELCEEYIDNLITDDRNHI